MGHFTVTVQNETGGVDDLSTDLIECTCLHGKVHVVEPVADGKGQPKRIN